MNEDRDDDIYYISGYDSAVARGIRACIIVLCVLGLAYYLMR